MVRAKWDTEKGEELRAWLLGGWITDVAVAPEGDRVAATGTEGFVWIIDLRLGRVVQVLDLAGAYGHGVAFAPKRPFLVTTDGDGNVRFWHRDTGQPIGIPQRFHGEVTRPRFAPDSDDFAVPAGSAMYLSGVPDPPGDLVSAGHQQLRLRGLDFSPKGTRLAVTDDGDNFAVFDPLKETRVQYARRPGLPALTLRYDPDPARPFVYRGTREGIERLAVPDGEKAEVIERTVWPVRADRIECLPGTGGLYVMGDKVVGRLDPVTLTRLAERRPVPDIPAGVNLDALAVRPDGKEVMVSLADRAVFLKGDTLEFLREWPVGDALLDARYTPDGTKVLVGRSDNCAELLDAATGKRVGALMTHTRGVAAVAVSPDGTVLLTGSRDTTARFWDAVSGLPLGAPMRHTGPVTHVAFSPTGDHIATGTGNGHVMIWDIPPPPAKGTIAELKANPQRKE